MIALDTNVIIRYVVQDDQKQAQQATTVIENLSQDNPAFISSIVLCEVNWVLKSAYNIPKEKRIEVLQHILSIGCFHIEQLECCIRALRKYESETADFSDYLIAEIAKQNGYDTVITFDKKALKSEDFKLP